MLNSTTFITSFFPDDIGRIRQGVIDGVKYTAKLHQVSPMTNFEYHYNFISTLNVSSSLDLMAVSIACGSTRVSIPCQSVAVTSKAEKGTRSHVGVAL